MILPFILIGFNIYSVFICIMLNSNAHLLYLIFPILFSSYYRSKKWIISCLLLTITEFILLYFYNQSLFTFTGSLEFFIHSLVILLFIIILSVGHSVRAGKEWESIANENKRMNTVLLAKEGYLELFFEHTQDAILVFSPDQHIIATNTAFEKVYGWKQEEVIGQKVQLVPNEALLDVEYRTKRILEGNTYHFLRSTELRKNGETFEAELTIAPIYDSKKQVTAITIIARDITSRIQAEKLMIDTEKLNAIGEIAASVAHEVRNPMTSISGFVQMMNNDPANPYKAYTEIMYNEIERINLIVSEFLILSKPNINLSSRFYVEDVLESVLQLMEHEISDRRIEHHVQLPPERFEMYGNKNSIKQVFINLLKNSCEAIHKRGLLTIAVSYKVETVNISIRDNGPGMDDETLQNLFEPFYTTKSEGTGLGMMITKKIVIDHNGKMIVKSNLNEGTETKLTFPLASNDENTA